MHVSLTPVVKFISRSFQLHDFNWEMNLFLKSLTSYQNNVNKANNTTMKLLDNILNKVNDFLAGADIEENENERPFFQIDETYFEFRNLITCRICHVSQGG